MYMFRQHIHIYTHTHSCIYIISKYLVKKSQKNYCVNYRIITRFLISAILRLKMYIMDSLGMERRNRVVLSMEIVCRITPYLLYITAFPALLLYLGLILQTEGTISLCTVACKLISAYYSQSRIQYAWLQLRQYCLLYLCCLTEQEKRI